MTPDVAKYTIYITVTKYRYTNYPTRTITETGPLFTLITTTMTSAIYPTNLVKAVIPTNPGVVKSPAKSGPIVTMTGEIRKTITIPEYSPLTMSTINPTKALLNISQAWNSSSARSPLDMARATPLTDVLSRRDDPFVPQGNCRPCHDYTECQVCVFDPAVSA